MKVLEIALENLYQQAAQTLNTVLDFARFGMSLFNSHELYFGHGTDNGWDDAMALIREVLYLPCDYNDPKILQAKLLDIEKKHVLALFKKRVESRKPVAYLTNKALFANIQFYVDERVLVPRSPIAEMINHHFCPWLENVAVSEILDLCTGSGCIGIACAYAFPEALVDLVDISSDALEVASINVEEHGLSCRVKPIQSDLFSDLSQSKKYDLIVTNPPYVSIEEIETLPNEYHHEPKLGLYAEDNGLAIASSILEQAANYLSDNGVLVLEVGFSDKALEEKYPNVPFQWVAFSEGGIGVAVLTKETLNRYFNKRK